MNTRLAFIMAGGSGERFWPVSTKENPKQFLKLADPNKTLIEQAVDRAAACVQTQHTLIATTRHLVESSLRACPQLQPHQIYAEPSKRNTAGCLVWMIANVMASHPESWPTTTIAVLTADQKISPESKFVEDLQKAFLTAEETGHIAIIGIPPTRPDTGFGYIELGPQTTHGFEVKSFREKPDSPTAEKYLQTQNFLWNSGMFIFTVPGFLAELERCQPEMAKILRQISGHLAAGDMEAAERTFDELPSISFDYAVMEKADHVHVIPASFEWDDLGSWDAIERSQSLDPDHNATLGNNRLIESQGNIVYNSENNVRVNLLGCKDLVVVVHQGQILICPKTRAQEVKKFLQE